MAGHIVVEGQKYEIPDRMKLGEARLIKEVAGIGLVEVEQALERGDPDLIAVLVMISMRRAGRRVELEQIDELDISEIVFEGEEEVGDGPPADAAGEPAAPVSGSPETTPSPSGTPPTANST